MSVFHKKVHNLIKNLLNHMLTLQIYQMMTKIFKLKIYFGINYSLHETVKTF